MRKQIIFSLIIILFGIYLGLYLYPIISSTYIVYYTENSTNNQCTVVINTLDKKSVNKENIEKKIENELNTDITINNVICQK